MHVVGEIGAVNYDVVILPGLKNAAVGMPSIRVSDSKSALPPWTSC